MTQTNFWISRLIIFASILSFFLFARCDSSRVYEKNVSLPDYVWDIKNIPSFEVEITDTVSKYNLYVNVRHASHYPYANLFLFSNLTFPNGKSRSDTIELALADPSTGKWKGDGMGDIWDNQIPWLQNVKFPIPGKYTFEFQHAMRLEQVPFVMDVGMRVEKAGGKEN